MSCSGLGERAIWPPLINKKSSSGNWRRLRRTIWIRPKGFPKPFGSEEHAHKPIAHLPSKPGNVRSEASQANKIEGHHANKANDHPDNADDRLDKADDRHKIDGHLLNKADDRSDKADDHHKIDGHLLNKADDRRDKADDLNKINDDLLNKADDHSDKADDGNQLTSKPAN
jgi:hypothetical protein